MEVQVGAGTVFKRWVGCDEWTDPIAFEAQMRTVVWNAFLLQFWYKVDRSGVPGTTIDP